MGIFSRIATIFSAKSHAALDRMENPVGMLNQYIRELETNVQKAESALVTQMGAESRLEKQYNEVYTMIQVREKQAEAALKSGDEGLAIRLIAEKKELEVDAELLKTQHTEIKQQLSFFQEEYEEMRRECQKLKNQRSSLIARHSYAKALTNIQRTMSQLNDDRGAVAGFNRINERISVLESEANARAALRSSRYASQDVSKLGRDAAVQGELLAMKARLNPAQ